MGLFGRRRVAHNPLPNEVREYVDAQIRIGFRPVADIVDLAHKLTEDGDTPPEGAIAKYADDVLVARRQQARAWAKEGDADRLARAFAHLDSLGIVARRSVASDRNAATAAIIDQRPAETTGFTYFLEGDAESLIREPASLQLAYGAFDTDPQGAAEQHRTIGATVVGVLEAHGLNVVWDGTRGPGIVLTPIVWQKLPPA